MEFTKKEQTGGPFHSLKSSFREIFGKPEKATLEVKGPRDETAGKDPEKNE
jgi:hypothetical protein